MDYWLVKHLAKNLVSVCQNGTKNLDQQIVCCNETHFQFIKLIRTLEGLVDGAVDGDIVGFKLGWAVGFIVGANVGLFVGLFDGFGVGLFVGAEEGLFDGTGVGLFDGSFVGADVGEMILMSSSMFSQVLLFIDRCRCE